LSCLSMLMFPLVPKTFAIVVVMALVLLALTSECGNGKNFNNTGAFAICCIDISPVWFLSNTCLAYSEGKVTSVAYSTTFAGFWANVAISIMFFTFVELSIATLGA